VRGVAAAVLTVLTVLACEGSAAAQDRFALASGCYAMRAQAPAGLVAKAADGSYTASAADVAGAERFRLQATALGHYLLYTRAGDFMAAVPGALPLVSAESVGSAAQASEKADWRVEDAGGGAFRIVLPAAGGRVLAASGPGGRLELAAPGDPARFTFEAADGCAAYPEVETNAAGTPPGGRFSFGEVRGLLDAHMHMMAFEFLGGRAHCGRPWHPYGAPHALVDCPDHHPNGGGAVLENTVSYGNPVGTHDPVGWPTFRDWPHHASLTHEGSYYKWLERAWRGGLRVFVNLFVDNAVLCEVYPLKKNSCDEMESVRLQARRIRELQDYIDAQSGGPGKGWFRIVTDPFEARRVIADGKLAVVLGIETSKLFGCGLFNEQAECDAAQIDRHLQEVYDLGVRDLELVNKFDNALGGVAGDAGQTGVAVNAANFYETGRFWQMQTCSDGHAHVHDREQATLPGLARDSLVGNGLQVFLPPGAAPVYPAPPHCNLRGLSGLGEHLVRRMIEKGMIIDPDHLSVRARQELLNVVEAEGYSGIVSSHSWSTPDAIPRIYELGGVVTPYAGDSKGFVEEWRTIKPMRDERFYFGFGYGADMNGFGAQGGPRGEGNPVSYPFRSFDGAVTLDRQRSGERVFDVNHDGVAHYGLYPDWVEDLRMIAGQEIVADMARGAEAYLQMWERAVGVPGPSCRAARARFTRRGLGRLRLGMASGALLRRAGQPQRRPGRAWSWCVRGERNRDAKAVAVLSPEGRVALVASTARGHRARGIGRGAKAGRTRRAAASRSGAAASRSGAAAPRSGAAARRPRLRVRTAAGPAARRSRLRVRPAGGGRRFVYGVRRGRVRFVAVASRGVASDRKRLRAHLRLAGLR
jgi:microsomal dipeptidase-like Zn-dependent dipeptidase